MVRREGSPDGLYDRVEEVVDLSQDRNGTDLALGRIGYTVEPVLALAEIPLAWGEDVVACGYPLPTDTRNPGDGTPLIKTEARLLRGYVTRVLLDDQSSNRPVRAVELDMPTFSGISGAPLFRPQPLEVAGVAYGERATVEAGSQLYPFALGHHLTTLMAAAGAATSGRPLVEYLRRRAERP